MQGHTLFHPHPIFLMLVPRIEKSSSPLKGEVKGKTLIKKNLFKNMVFKFSKLASKINLKPSELVLENAKCLCLVPHADDESIGMGGLLSLCPKLFDVVLLTDGRKGIKDVSTEDAINIREDEFKCALTAGGVNSYKFLRAEDKKLLDSFDLFKVIDVSSYDYIFVPNIIDQHPDHKAVSLLLQRLLQSGAKVKSDLKICFYEVWSTLGLVNVFVDISDVIDKKKAMINCYKSQIAQKDYEYHALGLNQYRGMLKDKKYVEAFCVLNKEEFLKISSIY